MIKLIVVGRQKKQYYVEILNYIKNIKLVNFMGYRNVEFNFFNVKSVVTSLDGV
jgi:hypothetical protein